MPRFFADKENIINDVIIIMGDDFNHIKNVLRMQLSDELTVCNKEGMDYLCVIMEIAKDKILLKIIKSYKSKTEPVKKVILVQGIPKSDKMNYIIQRCVELGIYKIIPAITTRTVVKFDKPYDLIKKTEKWIKVSEEAAKQSNRGIIPLIEFPMVFEKIFDSIPKDALVVIPYEEEKEKLLRDSLNENADYIYIIIGPEGGFEKQEVEYALEKGAFPVTLGPRILRTETAGPAVLSIVMYEMGEI